MTAIEDYFGHLAVDYEARAGEVAFVPPAVMQIETGQDFYTANSLSTITLDLDVQRAFDVRLRIGKVTTAPVFAVSGVGATSLKWPGGAQPAMSGETVIRFYGSGTIVYGMLIATGLRRRGRMRIPSVLYGKLTGPNQTYRLWGGQPWTTVQNLIAPLAGTLKGIGISADSMTPQGTATVRLYKNDVLTGDTLVIQLTSPYSSGTYQWDLSVPVAACDLLGIDVVSNALFPVSDKEFVVTMEVEA